MTFALYTEELNLVCAIAEEEADDELRKLEISSVLDSSSIQRPRSSKEEHNNAAVAKATKTEGGGSFVLGSWASHWHELYAVFHLAGPTIILQMSAVLPGFATASYIGRNLDAVHLDGFALASLTINLFTLSILQGLYSASDTLSPQAYGAGNFAEVGHLAVRGFCGSLLITLPTLSIMAVYMPRLLLAVGIEAEIASYAWHWYLVTIVGVPCTALYQVTWKFLSAQNVMNPLVVCSMLSSGIVLPISLFGFGSRYGFLGTALANVVVQIASVALLFAYLTTFRPHNPSTWPGLSRAIPQALQWKPFSEYMVRTFVLSRAAVVVRAVKV